MYSNVTIMNGLTASGDLTSDSFNIKGCSNFSIHATWTSTPVGDLIVKASNDGTNFQEIARQSTAGESQYLLNYSGAGFDYVHVFYDSTSGTGVMTITASAKV